jgi:hypothetical protein
LWCSEEDGGRAPLTGDEARALLTLALELEPGLRLPDATDRVHRRHFFFYKYLAIDISGVCSTESLDGRQSRLGTVG